MKNKVKKKEIKLLSHLIDKEQLSSIVDLLKQLKISEAINFYVKKTYYFFFFLLMAAKR